jgi:putative ABC transport system ATP-binding protein
MVTHDPSSAKRASRCLEMFDGQLIKDSLNHERQVTVKPAELAAG